MGAAPIDLSYLRERLAELDEQLSEAAESIDRPAAGDPALVAEALAQLFGVLDQLGGRGRSAASSQELNTLGDYGLHLLADLADIARSLQRRDVASEIEQLSLPYALLIARNGGEIRNLAPVVAALDHCVDPAARPGTMAALCSQCCELIDAASPAAQEGLAEDPSHPWRRLLLHRATVATRSRNPALIGPAYDAVLEWLPEDAQDLFAEAMEQTAATDYPEPARELVQRYFRSHGMPRRLH